MFTITIDIERERKDKAKYDQQAKPINKLPRSPTKGSRALWSFLMNGTGNPHVEDLLESMY